MKHNPTIRTARLPEAIRRARELAGISQAALAAAAETKPAAIAAYENGSATPNVHTLDRIAWAMGLTIDELLAGPWRRVPRAPS